MTTLNQALEAATEYWRANTAGADIQEVRAKACAEALGDNRTVKSLTMKDAQFLLGYLRQTRNLQRKSVADYYATFKRMIALSGAPLPADFARWPKAPTPARRTRTMLTPMQREAVISWLDRRGYPETGDLVAVLGATGVRVQCEALQRNSLRVRKVAGDLLLVHVTGKGGHEREVPVDPITRAGQVLQNVDGRLHAMRCVPYKTHLRRFKDAVREIYGEEGLATPHSLRHSFASEALSASGGNLAMVQELLGHSDPGTTAIYAHVGFKEKVAALMGNPRPTTTHGDNSQ